jgi:hypothetical protein
VSDDARQRTNKLRARGVIDVDELRRVFSWHTTCSGWVVKRRAFGVAPRASGRKNMKFNVKATLALFAGCALYASSANAATLFVQAGSGHPHLTSGAVGWPTQWNVTSWTIVDGRSARAVTSTAAWDTLIPISETGVNWTVKAFGADGSGQTIYNRICTFDSAGNFFSCGAYAFVDPTIDDVSTAFVPTDGTMYSQSFFDCLFASSCSGATLFHVKAFD